MGKIHRVKLYLYLWETIAKRILLNPQDVRITVDGMDLPARAQQFRQRQGKCAAPRADIRPDSGLRTCPWRNAPAQKKNMVAVVHDNI